MKAIPKIKLGKEYQASVNYEVKKQVLHMADMTGAHFDSLVLYALAKQGWGKHRLRRFYEEYDKSIKELCNYYEGTMIDSKGIFEVEYCAVAELKRIGVDVERWRAEKHNWNPENDECWMSYNCGRKLKNETSKV